MNSNDNLRFLNVGLPDDIARCKAWGDFEGAIRLIDRRLAQDNIPDALRACLTAEREIMRRIPADYPLTRADALAEVRAHIPDFTEEEFDERVDAGKIGWLYIGGEMRFFDRFFSTMCKAEPAFAARAGVKLYGVESVTAEEGEGRLDHVHRRMRENGKIANRIRIRASVRVKDEVFTPGMFVRVHLPLPAACEQQSDIRIEALYPPNGRPAPEDALQRTVCWEETMTENHEFSVEYSYVHTARYHDVSAIEPDAAQPCFDTGEEAPHIIFTPYLRALVQALTEGVDSLLERARIFYDFITLNMKYTFMPAYFILENIAEAAARSYTGDCGVFALLFVTLCRCAGIPAPTAGSTPTQATASPPCAPGTRHAAGSTSAISTPTAWWQTMRFRRRLPFQSSTGAPTLMTIRSARSKQRNADSATANLNAARKFFSARSFPSDPKQRKEA